MAKKLTLSFDNGPTPGVTDAVLDELARRALKASFFVVGERVLAPGGRSLVERAAAEGHWVGNHTMHHRTPFGLADGSYARDEIAQAEAAIAGLAQERRLFRPYAGGGVLGPHVLSRAAVSHLAENGYTLVIWNSVPGDWKLPFDRWSVRAMADIDGQDWTLVVLHDIRPELARDLPAFLDLVQEAGVEIAQAFPPGCVLMDRGRRIGDISGLVAP